MFREDTDDLAAFLALVDMAGLMPDMVDKAVNGTDNEDLLGWYDVSDRDRAMVCAAFHVLGQELLAHCKPTAALLITGELVQLRNATMLTMKELPR